MTRLVDRQDGDADQLISDVQKEVQHRRQMSRLLADTDRGSNVFAQLDDSKRGLEETALQATIDKLPGYATSRFWQEHKQQHMLATLTQFGSRSPGSTLSPFLKTAHTSKKSPGQTATSKPSLETTLGQFKDKYAVNTSKQPLKAKHQDAFQTKGTFGETLHEIVGQQQNFGFTSAGWDNSFEKSFAPLSPVKRRSPDYYIRNPTKIYGKTFGKLDLLWLDHAKQSEISAHDTTTERDYLPRAPQMKEARAFVRSVNKVLQANESILTLGGTGRIQNQTQQQGETRLKPVTLERHKNSEFSAFLMNHTKPAIN